MKIIKSLLDKWGTCNCQKAEAAQFYVYKGKKAVKEEVLFADSEHYDEFLQFASNYLNLMLEKDNYQGYKEVSGFLSTYISAHNRWIEKMREDAGMRQE